MPPPRTLLFRHRNPPIDGKEPAGWYHGAWIEFADRRRHALIFHIWDTCVVKPHESKEHQKTSRIDRILTGKWTAIPCFIAIMLTVFLLTFNVIGGWLQKRLGELIDMGSAAADAALTQAGVSEALHGLIIDGIFAGVGSVLSFLPIILVMFLFLSLLEDSGYLARVAFFMDKPLRRIGLSGRSIVPLLVGFGCTVPAVMSARPLPSYPRDAPAARRSFACAQDDNWRL